MTTLHSSSAGEKDLTFVGLWFRLLVFTSSNVCCGPWHLLYYWSQGHCLTKCHGFKQLRHDLFSWQFHTSCHVGMVGRTCRQIRDICLTCMAHNNPWPWYGYVRLQRTNVVDALIRQSTYFVHLQSSGLEPPPSVPPQAFPATRTPHWLHDHIGVWPVEHAFVFNTNT